MSAYFVYIRGRCKLPLRKAAVPSLRPSHAREG